MFLHFVHLLPDFVICLYCRLFQCLFTQCKHPLFLLLHSLLLPPHFPDPILFHSPSILASRLNKLFQIFVMLVVLCCDFILCSVILSKFRDSKLFGLLFCNMDSESKLTYLVCLLNRKYLILNPPLGSIFNVCNLMHRNLIGN